jgi:hypothetical protein
MHPHQTPPFGTAPGLYFPTHCRYYTAHRQNIWGGVVIGLSIILVFGKVISNLVKYKRIADVVTVLLGLGGLYMFVSRLIPAQVWLSMLKFY